ncbi:flagellar FlbD family protein [Hathewaya limosa]|uniref:Flagellar protein FlbD n=1 Tax=Hathewaya limosa TaxID=1536 RepID=A0ABU0JQB4_HATLI|nr:flagellar FlbD family protein [Hathewaya limosa]MDQ0479263.1 flagellar protein FlbD [Hathewaya limosa]
MIRLTSLNNKEFYLNEDNIEKIEEVPDTVITMSNDKKYLVKENIDEVMEKILQFKRRYFDKLR